MGHEITPSPQATRLAPKFIAVIAELAAGSAGASSAAALASGQPLAGALMLAFSAASLAAKNWSQLKTAGEAQSPTEGEIQAILSRYESVAAQMTAIEVDQHLHELISRERMAELRQLLSGSRVEIEQRISENQEVLFQIARFLDRWCAEHTTSLATIELQLNLQLEQIQQELKNGFEQNQATLSAIQDAIKAIDKKLDTAPLPPGVVPVQPEAPTIGTLAQQNQLEIGQAIGTDIIDNCRRRMLDESASVLRWRATVGTGRHRILPRVQGELLATIRESKNSTHLLLGPKGIGKSALLAAIGNSVLEHGVVIFGFRSDRLPAEVTNADDLQRHFRFQIPLAEAIRLVATRYKVLLIIDQLDSVSELTDRRSNRLNLLLDLIRALSGTQNLHILAACREFDYRHDARLTTLDAVDVPMESPPWPEVAEVLRAEGHSPDVMASPMQELLRVPWALNLFLHVAKPGDVFGSMQSLIEAVWARDVTSADGPSGREALAERIACRMSVEEELFVPMSLADDAPDSRHSLLRNDILVTEAGGRALAFRHQTFYDYILARMFARGTIPLAQHVSTHEDGLFVRPAMWNGLELLRDSSRKEYHRQIGEILGGTHRQHIRSLLLEFIAGQPNPDEAEVAVVLPLVSQNEGPLILRAAAGSRGWFAAFRYSGAFANLMKQPTQRAGLCLWALVSALTFDQRGVFELVSQYWALFSEYDHLVAGVAQYLARWDDDWCEIVCSAVRRSNIQIIFTAERIAATDPSVAARLVRAELDRQFSEADKNEAAALQESLSRNRADDDSPTEGALLAELRRTMHSPFARLIDSTDNDRYGLESIAEKAAKPFMKEIWPWFISVMERVARSPGRSNTYKDDHVTYLSYDLHPNPLIAAIHVAADQWAMDDPASFVAFAEDAAKTDFLVAHRILAQAYVIAAKKLSQAAFDYLLGDPRRLMVGTGRDVHSFSTNLIAAIFPSMNHAQRQAIETAILKFDAFLPSAYSREDPSLRLDMLRWTRQHRLRLLRAIPKEFMSDRARSHKESEELQLPGTPDIDREPVRFGQVGPRMTTDELVKAGDDEILGLIDDLMSRAAVNSPRAFRTDIEIGRSGGIREQARAIGSWAEMQPRRALGMLDRLSALRDEHQDCAGAIIEGIGKSPLSGPLLFGAITELDDRGFAGGEFRERCAYAIEERARHRSEIPGSALRFRLTQWLHEVSEPSRGQENDALPLRETRGPVVLVHGGVLSPLMPGRAAVFRAISAVCGSPQPADAGALVDVAKGRIGKEEHPKVVGEMLMYLHPAFTVKDAVADASSVFVKLVEMCPASLNCDAAVHEMGALIGHFEPDETNERILTYFRTSAGAGSRQAFGELLFLYYARRVKPSAAEQIKAAASNQDDDILLGLGYCASETWLLPHCRECATCVLSACAQRADKEFLTILERSFIPAEDELFPCDEFTKSVLAALCRNPAALRVAGGQALDAIMHVAGTQPDVVLALGNAIVSTIGTDLSGLWGGLTSVAANLTNLAITLHRQEKYRAAGLDLFEDLLRLGISEAAIALSMLDRKPSQSPGFIPPPAHPRRRRRRR